MARYHFDKGNMTCAMLTSFVGGTQMLASEYCNATGTSTAHFSRWIKNPDKAEEKISDELQVKTDNLISNLLTRDPKKIADFLATADYVAAVCLLTLGSVPETCADKITSSRVAQALLSPELPADNMVVMRSKLAEIVDRKIFNTESDAAMRKLMPKYLEFYSKLVDEGIDLEDFIEEQEDIPAGKIAKANELMVELKLTRKDLTRYIKISDAFAELGVSLKSYVSGKSTLSKTEKEKASRLCEQLDVMPFELRNILDLYAKFKAIGVRPESLFDGMKRLPEPQLKKGRELMNKYELTKDDLIKFTNSETYRSLVKHGLRKTEQLRNLLTLNNISLKDLIRMKEQEEAQ